MPKPGKSLINIGLGAAALLGLAALLLALPVPVWRTGRLPVTPLPVVENGPAIEPAGRIWIDTDPACGLGRRADPDDCLALLLLARAADDEIAGISTVFGNAKLDDTDRTARSLAARLRRDGAEVPGVLRGAAAPGTVPTETQRGLRRALADGPLTIVALGPLTNIAAALKGRPDLQKNVRRIIAVMGRRPGHIFHPSEGHGDGILFGHGPVFRDLNFDLDRGAAVDLLGTGLPISLIPYDVARGITLAAADLDRIARTGAAGAWVASGARGWLDFWRDDIGLDGFHPFDLMAGAYALEPRLFDCAAVAAWIAKDDRLNNFWFFDPLALQVGLPSERPDDPAAQAPVTYCVTTDPALRPWLMERLTRGHTPADTD